MSSILYIYILYNTYIMYIKKKQKLNINLTHLNT
jgi:hypothetical protein